jgi:prepilin-type N-terminal cleavage/methylation domain-containing protein
MPSTPSIPRLRAEAGFSLIEMLVATTVMLAVLAASGPFFAVGSKRIQDQILTIETLQGLRAAEDSMIRDLRLGGACLPTTGDFVTLDATNSTADTIFTRTGLVQPNETCIRNTLSADLNANASQLSLQSAAGFAVGMRAYIRTSSGTTGEVFTITGVNTSTNVLQKTTTLTCPQVGTGCPTPAYPSGSGVFAVDERLYAVDSSNPALPKLTIAANGAAATPFAFGITNLQLQYELAQNCDGTGENCTVVDIPVNDTQFALVNQIYITLTAKSLKTLSTGQYYTVTRTVTAKPRNLLPGSG